MPNLKSLTIIFIKIGDFFLIPLMNKFHNFAHSNKFMLYFETKKSLKFVLAFLFLFLGYSKYLERKKRREINLRHIQASIMNGSFIDTMNIYKDISKC